MSIDPHLLELLVCPACHSELQGPLGGPDGGPPELVCTGCGLAYPIRDGIPVMLVDEARAPGPGTQHATGSR